MDKGSKQISFVLFILFILLFSPYHALMKDKLFADDASYLAHGFTLGLDHNLAYEQNVAEWKTANEKAAAHPVGPGLLAAPFIAAFSIIDKVMHHPVIEEHIQFQYSWSYFGFVFSSVFFFIAGLFLYLKAIRCLSLNMSAPHFIYIACSFGILFYVLFRPVMGHSFEFFTIALCFWASCNLYCVMSQQNKLSIGYLFIAALGIVLTMQIRPADINIIVLPAIVLSFLFMMRETPISAVERKNCLLLLPLLLLSMVICFLPFALINHQLYDMIYPTSSAMYGETTNPVPTITNISDFIKTLSTLIYRLPHILTICFSSEFGLFFTSAILLFGSGFLIYFALLNLRKKGWLAFFVLIMIGGYIALPVTITLFWQSVGDAYGYRFLFCLFPLALLGYGFWNNQLKEHFVKAKLLQGIILVLCGYGLLGNALFGLNDDLMYKPGITNSFGREGGAAVGYNVAVLKSIPKATTWVNLTATRTPGFFAIGLLDLLALEPQKLNLPKSLAEKLDKFYCCYQRPPLQVYLQAVLVGLLFLGGSLFLIIKFNNKAS